MSSYNDLDIYKIAYELAVEVHHLSLTLPTFELYEQGNQIRRSSKSIKDNIAEGYGRKRYKAEFVKFLTYAQASCNETTSQLSMISILYFSENPLNELIERYNHLGSKINKFIQYIESNWRT
ncbi:four helix bundle protein [uncultured Draconibacterium sp.]|uniref:four helix bundle protein n=1 Tax=uncultured Draconibacterium sp. TaxID=1573823 RepID=UPI003217F66B